MYLRLRRAVLHCGNENEMRNGRWYGPLDQVGHTLLHHVLCKHLRVEYMEERKTIAKLYLFLNMLGCSYNISIGKNK